jgi:hypothetical protein
MTQPVPEIWSTSGIRRMMTWPTLIYWTIRSAATG